MRRKTHERFINEIKLLGINTIKILGIYERGENKIEVKCNTCNLEWKPIAQSLLNGHGCPDCGHKKNREAKTKKHSDFINEIFEVHGKNLNIVGNYTRGEDKIKAKCIICNLEWFPEAKRLLKGHGCPDCGHKKNKESTTKKHNDFINEVFKIHGDRLNISGDYINAYTRIDMKCNLCKFEWSPISANLIKGRGCPKCNISKGEQLIHDLLIELNINFNQYYVVKELKTKRGGRVEFDFYLSDLNICIEYDGIHHFKPIKKWGGSNRLLEQQMIDLFKNNYCSDNDIKLIRIPYTDIKKINKKYLIKLIKN